MTITTVLVANRGEIACRVIRSAQAQGLRAIAVYSDADAEAPHVQMADDAVRIGAGPVGESYLRGDRILDAAKDTGADAIHPGYGFLSENAAFAQAVADAGLVFIGPPAAAIDAMGNKAEAKRLMIAAGVPCVPGYEGEDQSDAVLAEKAGEIGFPVMVKAAAGGGGRGMRLVHEAAQIADAIALARSEAENAFGSGELIIEKAIIEPRHVEVQVFADTHGNVVHLGERDCSVQRRHQKVVEEAPCPVMTPELRDQMGKAAVDAAKAVNYVGAGTVEFLLDTSGAFYFLEMNTRLQVEHPVTELVTGLDLVALQLAVADGAPLPIAQDDVTLTGHAIEVRLYAEDPANDYLPATGRIDLWHPASGPGVRVDSGILSGQEVSPFYDAMLAKIIAYGETREVARARLIKAVEDSVLLGVKTNSAFLADVLAQTDFVTGNATTALLDQAYPEGYVEDPLSRSDLALAAALLGRQEQQNAFGASAYVSATQLGWTSVVMKPAEIQVMAEDETHSVSLSCAADGWTVGFGENADPVQVVFKSIDGSNVRARIDGKTVDAVAHLDGDRVTAAIDARRFSVVRLRAGSKDADGAGGGRITAPMPGLVLDIVASEGQRVSKGETLAVLEAMKMQHQMAAPFDGTVTAVHVESGKQVAAGDVMIEIEEAD